MDVNKLVRMANQIAANFDGGSNEAAAVAGVADHMRRFWTPSMRRQIVEHWQEQRGDLSPRAAQAIAAIAD